MGEEAMKDKKKNGMKNNRGIRQWRAKKAFGRLRNITKVWVKQKKPFNNIKMQRLEQILLLFSPLIYVLPP